MSYVRSLSAGIVAASLTWGVLLAPVASSAQAASYQRGGAVASGLRLDGEVTTLTSRKAFDEALAEGGRLTVVAARAAWCGPCRASAPSYAALAEKYPEAGFYRFDVDDLPDVAEALAVRAVPAYYLFRDGKELGSYVNAAPAKLDEAVRAAYDVGGAAASAPAGQR
jgi:thioredoxin 1